MGKVHCLFVKNLDCNPQPTRSVMFFLATQVAALSPVVTPRFPAPLMQDTTTTSKPVQPIAGDYGFDPLGLGTAETLVPYREAELKHARLAMLASVWRNTYDMMAETNGKSPSLLNGGLEQWETFPALMLAVFLASVLELQNLKAREADGLSFNEFRTDTKAGDYGFDPLNIIGSLSPAEKFEFEEKELLNGRLAMIAVTCYVAEEFVFDMPVIRFTPDLFEPLILAPDFRAFMDQAFSAASMDGSINGIAY